MYSSSLGCIRPFRTPNYEMRRTLLRSATKSLLLASALSWVACGEATSSSEPIAVTIESQESIVSENGELQLTRGTLAIQSVSLIGETADVPLVGPVTIDLSIRTQELPLVARIPAGSYTGLRIELAPEDKDANTLDVDLRSVMTQESVRAISKLAMSGDAGFPEGSRAVTESSEVELNLLLRGMFFYLAPLSDAVDGVYTAGENHRDFLTMDLIGMFDLRVLP
jgi:hypothetical protein